MKLLLIPYLVAQMAMGAPVEVKVHYMPLGERVWVPSINGWGRGYTLKDYKLLLEMDGDLYTVREQLTLIDDLKLNWDSLLNEKDDLLTEYKEVLVIHDARTTRLDKKWNKCEGDLVEASGGDYLPWIIAAIGAGIGIAGASIAIGMALSN